MTVQPRDLQPGRGVCFLVFGLPGAGKTTFAASYSGGKVLLVHPPTDHTDSVTPRAGVQEIIVEDHAKLLEVFQWGQQGGFEKYDWVWLDGITLLEEHGLADVFAAEIIRHPDRADYGPDKGEYGINRSRLMNHVRDMVGLAKSGMMNFGLTAHVLELYDPVNEREYWAPAFGSSKTQSGLKLAAMFNIVAYMQARQEEGKDRKQLLTVDADGFVGQDKLKVFPKLKSGRHGFINPTMDDVQAAIDKRHKPPARRRGRSKPLPASAKRKRTRRRK